MIDAAAPRGAELEADLFDYCPVFAHSLLGVSKEGRESIPLWRVFSPYFSASGRLENMPAACF